jgi:hypothetical protein
MSDPRYTARPSSVGFAGVVAPAVVGGGPPPYTSCMFHRQLDWAHLRTMAAAGAALALVGCTEAIPPPADVAAPPADATVTASNLAYKILKKGDGTEHPKPTSKVRVHYTGWTTDGKMFDSSVARGQPIEFPLNGVIAGWTEGLQLMVVNDKARLWIPEELAYKGKPGRPAGMLVFDVELLGMVPSEDDRH